MLKTYAHHAPTEAGIDKLTQIRQAFSELHKKLEEVIPNCRERSVALTHIETAAMWANKGLIFSDPNSTPTQKIDEQVPG